jgi:hypothetical protein
LTNRGNVNQKDTVLSENDVLITKQDEVCKIFNNFFVLAKTGFIFCKIPKVFCGTG